MKKPLLVLAPVVLIALLGVTACGTSNAPAAAPAASTPAATAPAATTPATTASATQTANPVGLAMTILPGGKLGPDGKMHDIFSPTDLTVVQGQATTVTVYNYDTGAHSFTSKDLNLNVMIPGAKKDGAPAVTTFTINATKAGDFHWLCTVKCDTDANGWAMANDGYMAGTVHVLAQQPDHDTLAMTIKDGAKLGPDGKMHDVFTNTDLTVRKGVPAQVTVYNYDTGDHSFTSKDLGLNVHILGAKKAGVPSVTTFTINATKTGSFHWLCTIKCDSDANGWAMANNGYMAGTVTVVD
ncbi:MAG: cupredoxin domain-containing protein [Peptococcaceae bacterium]|nr:cupredoxin domain-containing protein [Peptococcaceae bacterium]